MRRFIILTLVGILAALPAQAGNNGRGHGRGNQPEHTHSQDHKNDDTTIRVTRDGSIRFSTRDLNVIIDWFKTAPVAGRSNTRSLPPGLAKQLRERGHLPPGLEAKGLPPSLAERLGPAPRGYERIVVGKDVILAQIATGIIVDILKDVF